MLQGALPDTRAFDGCELLEVHANQDEPGHLLFVQQWASRSHQEKYLGWRMETGMLDLIEPYVTAPPKFTYFHARPEV